jgi:hypothetical protein
MFVGGNIFRYFQPDILDFKWSICVRHTYINLYNTHLYLRRWLTLKFVVFCLFAVHSSPVMEYKMKLDEPSLSMDNYHVILEPNWELVCEVFGK